MEIPSKLFGEKCADEINFMNSLFLRLLNKMVFICNVLFLELARLHIYCAMKIVSGLMIITYFFAEFPFTYSTNIIY